MEIDHYYTSEVLILREGKDPKGIRGDFADRVSLIGEMLRCGMAEVRSCRLKTEDGEWDFSGRKLTGRLRAIVRRLTMAQNIDFRIRYTWRVHISRGQASIDFVRFDSEPRFLRTLRSDYYAGWKAPAPEELLFWKGSGFLYSLMYSFTTEEDGGWEDGDQRMFAFGERDGKLYCGMVCPVEVSLKDCNGSWLSRDIDLRLPQFCPPPHWADAEVQSCVKKLISFTDPTAGGIVPTRLSSGGIGPTRLSSPYDAAAYICAALRYMQLTGTQSLLDGEYLDETTDLQVRLLSLEFWGSGWQKFRAEITQI